MYQRKQPTDAEEDCKHIVCKQPTDKNIQDYFKMMENLCERKDKYTVVLEPCEGIPSILANFVLEPCEGIPSMKPRKSQK